jgi:hypothetical protein
VTIGRARRERRGPRREPPAPRCVRALAADNRLISAVSAEFSVQAIAVTSSADGLAAQPVISHGEPPVVRHRRRFMQAAKDCDSGSMLESRSVNLSPGTLVCRGKS